uniref:Coiled-coil domain-containing protein 22 n=1 Tax=Sphenodon punctatus TaxID=8508 RepID=A0A8D0GVT3_SPHPU
PNLALMFLWGGEKQAGSGCPVACWEYLGEGARSGWVCLPRGMLGNLANPTTPVSPAPERKAFYDAFLPLVSAQPPRPASLVPSLLERNAAELSAAQDWESEWKSQGLGSRLAPEEYRQWKRQRLQRRLLDQLRQAVPRADPSQLGAAPRDLAQLLGSFSAGAGGGAGALAKGSRFTRAQRLAHKQEAEPRLPVESLLPSRASEQVIGVEWGQGGLSWSLPPPQVEGETRQRQLGVSEREQSLRVKGRTVELLPDAENNLAKLQLVVESSAQRIIQLAAQWEKHRVPLIQEFRQLKALHDSKELASSRRLSEIQELHKRIQAAADEARRKEEVYKQLLSELESLPKDVSRSAYTQRILEIVGNICKQKEEITKILLDTKDLQKEINSLTGKLDRTFAVTDELVFKVTGWGWGGGAHSQNALGQARVWRWGHFPGCTGTKGWCPLPECPWASKKAGEVMSLHELSWLPIMFRLEI